VPNLDRPAPFFRDAAYRAANGQARCVSFPIADLTGAGKLLDCRQSYIRCSVDRAKQHCHSPWAVVHT